MRIAVLADIRANETALLAVFADLEQKKVEHAWVIGSLLSDGPDPAAVIKKIRERTNGERCLIGHPDQDIIQGGALATYNKHARDAFLWAHQRIRSKWWSLPSAKRRWNWIKALGSHGTEGVWQFFSCTPQCPDADFLPVHVPIGRNEQLVPHFERVNQGAFVGSIGRPGIVFADTLEWQDATAVNNQVAIGGRRFIACPGSVGQPRDRNPDSAYAIFNGETISWHRVRYDIEKTIRRIDASPRLGRYCGLRLKEGV